MVLTGLVTRMLAAVVLAIVCLAPSLGEACVRNADGSPAAGHAYTADIAMAAGVPDTADIAVAADVVVEAANAAAHAHHANVTY